MPGSKRLAVSSNLALMPPATPQLIVMPAVPDAVAARARQEFGAVLPQADLMSLDEAISLIAQHSCPALLVSGRVKLRAPEIAQLPPALRIVATYSVGYDQIDVVAARARGLTVTNTPDVLTAATADMTLLLMLCACRRAHEYDTIMHAGWRRNFGLADMLGLEMSGRTVGIVGMGRIGRAVARRARGFDMRLLYHNRRPLADDAAEGAQYYAQLEQMLPLCDIVTLHAPATDTPLMSAAMLNLMPRGSVLVNAGRGSLLDENALIEALTSGRLAAAGLDTFMNEPNYDLRFRELPNVFLTPHMGSATRETRDAMGMRALDNIAAALRGEIPRDAILE
jgi:lactate dehydrogenase-like 2-hydroxyacid dehydrogenase